MNRKNFDGERYFHSWPESPKGLLKVLKWQLTRDVALWPIFVVNTKKPSFPTELQPEDISITFVNHATVYLEHAGLKIITDPHWGQRASPFSFVGPKRVRAAGVEIEKLPGLDYVFVSHNHYDHFHSPTLKKLNELYHPQFLIPKGDAYLLKKVGITNYKELDWWDEIDAVQGRKITFVPVKHWSARGLNDRNKSLWGGFVLTTPSQKIFFSGDSGYCDIFSTLSEKFGEFSLSLLPIGAYEPREFMKDAHMNPDEAVQAHIDLKSKYSVAIHFGLWQLTDEAIDQPVKDLKIALKKKSIIPNSFLVLDVGETKVLR